MYMTGLAVAASDINGDGIQDVIIGVLLALLFPGWQCIRCIRPYRLLAANFPA